MLIDLFNLIASGLIAVVVQILSLIPFIIPAQIGNSIRFVLEKLLIVQGVFPIHDFLLAGIFFVSFLTIWYTLKVMLFALGFLKKHDTKDFGKK